MNTFEALAILFSFILGALCLRGSKSPSLSPVILFWAGISFMFISLVRTLYVVNLIDIYQRGLMVGMFYPLVVWAIFIDTRKRKEYNFGVKDRLFDIISLIIIIVIILISFSVLRKDLRITNDKIDNVTNVISGWELDK